MNVPFMYKYKPSSFNDFEMNTDIINILKTIISMDNLNIFLNK